MAMSFVVLVAVASILAYAGIKLGSEVLKYISVVGQLYALFAGIRILVRFRKAIIWKRATPLLVVTALYPFVRIVWDASSDFQFKTLTDTIIASGGYYQLPVIALALAVLTQQDYGARLLWRYALFALPVGFALIPVIVGGGEENGPGWGTVALNNLLIPVALLALNPSRKYRAVVGWLGIALIFFVSARIWSRSYTLVAGYLTLFAILASFISGHKRIGFGLCCTLLLLYLLGASSIFSDTAAVRDASVADKFQLDTLMQSLQNFVRTGDVLQLFYWSGNSRSGILIDAFGSFSLSQWLFGRGILARYQSFVER
ncbi:MAG: hypothetical protein EOO88_55830, partial [Pedobacter sp.]